MTNSSPQSPDQLPGTLRSLKDLEGYKISAQDGDIGKVHDFLFDDGFWIVRYVVVDTAHWLAGSISWDAKQLKIILSRESIEHSPEFNPSAPVNPEYEIRLHDYHGRPTYGT